MSIGLGESKLTIPDSISMDLLLNKVALAITFALQVFILHLLIRHRLQRRFSWFLTYIIYELVESALRLSVAGNQTLYFKVYWLTAIGGVILSVMAVGESFLNVFWLYTRLRWFTGIVWGCVALALLYAVFKAWAFPPVHASRLISVILGLEVAVDYSVAVVGILYFLFVRFVKIKEHQWESGVISGFTTIAVLSVGGALTRSVFGTRFGLVNEWLGAVAYILAEIEWILVLCQSEREASAPLRDLTNDDLTRFDQYITIVQRILGRKP